MAGLCGLGLKRNFLDPGDLASESELTIMSELSDGDHVIVDQDKVTHWPKTMVARTKDVAFSQQRFEVLL